VLGHYVREKKLMPLNEAVHRMTGLSAGNFMLKDRGLIRQGYYADITIFNADTVIDKATYEKPKQYALGIETVIVNGQIAWQNGGASGARVGKVLKRTGT
jgi:N-acyl-D-amino-acid deacylase